MPARRRPDLEMSTQRDSIKVTCDVRLAAAAGLILLLVLFTGQIDSPVPVGARFAAAMP